MKTFLHLTGVLSLLVVLLSPGAYSESSGGGDSGGRGALSLFSRSTVSDVVAGIEEGVVHIAMVNKIRRYHSRVSEGSGCMLTEDGLVLTNAHVVLGDQRTHDIVVGLSSGEKFDAKVLKIDEVHDLALLQIDAGRPLKPLQLGSSKGLRRGEWVLTLGSPLTLSKTVTIGIVSTPDRRGADIGLDGNEIQYIQTDAAITFGNSGGSMADLDGRVIGINSLVVTNGISFALPIEYAKEFLAQHLQLQVEESISLSHVSEHVCDADTSEKNKQRLYLGVSMVALTEDLLDEIDFQLYSSGRAAGPVHAALKGGVLIGQVQLHSPAFLAGLRQADVITRINQQHISSVKQVFQALCDNDREHLHLEVLREGSYHAVDIMPE